MTRIAALVAVIALLIASGFWLARRAPHAQANAAGGGASVSAQAPEATADDVALPDGYQAVPYLSDAPQRAFEKADQVLEPGLDYVAVLVTNRGDLTLQLFAQQAPHTVNNFVFLALHHYYDGVPFHRVLEGFMAQTGDPTGTGTGGPGYAFDDEIAPDLHFDKRGVVAMANAGPNTNGSQFFITFNEAPWLDGHYNIFGQLVAGDDVLDSITRIDPQNPTVVAPFDETVADLAQKGVELPGAQDATVGDALAATLGTRPVAGQAFDVAGFRGVVGSVGGQPAVGFFPRPDTLERVVIATKPAP